MQHRFTIAIAIACATTMAATGTPAIELDLVVWLRDRPGGVIAREVRRGWEPASAATEQIREIHRNARPGVSLSPAEEEAFLAVIRNGESLLRPVQLAELRTLGDQVERQEAAMREEIRRRIIDAVADDQAAIESRVLALGGTVKGWISSQNAASVRLPAGRLPELAADPLVARIILLPAAEPELDHQATSLGLADGFWADGLDGGTWDVGVIDTGVQQDHPALNPVFLSNAGTTDADGHGTAVAGIILSRDATCRGMAFGLDAMLVASSDDPLPAADWMVTTAAQDPEAINLSIGYGTADDGDYQPFDQFWDGLVDDHSVLVVTSAGNGGDGTTTLTHPSPAYNVLAVANVDDQNTAMRFDDVIHPTSSRGPTLAGRKKPDLSAPGELTLTTNHDWAGAGPEFVDLSGSSAAAPHVTGGVVLLTELRGSDNPMANKAVLINTADAWTDAGTSGDPSDDGEIPGSEWNKTYGWGYVDLWGAWFNGLDVFVHTIDDGGVPAAPDYKLYRGFMYGGEKATLVWNRHLGWDGSNYPSAVEELTDLDLYVFDEETGDLLGASTSRADNVEQISVVESADVVLKVEVFGTIDPDVGQERFALATEENFATATAPSFSYDPEVAQVSPGQSFELTVTVLNEGTAAAFDNAVELDLPAGFSVASGGDPQALGRIAGGGGGQAGWTVTAACGVGPYELAWTHTSASYGGAFSGSGAVAVEVGPASLVDDVPVDGFVVPRTFEFPVLGSGWAAVGLDPGTRDHDVRTDDDLCITSPYQTSTYSGTVREFTITNGHLYGNATHYALVSYGASSPYTIELDQTAGVAVGVATDAAFAANEVIETFEVAMTAGTTYRVTVAVTSGLTDVALFGFRPDRPSAKRATADYAADAGPAGADEELVFTAPVDGSYAFVVVNDNAQTSTFRFMAEVTTAPEIFSDGFESGDTSRWSVAIQ